MRKSTLFVAIAASAAVNAVAADGVSASNKHVDLMGKQEVVNYQKALNPIRSFDNVLISKEAPVIKGNVIKAAVTPKEGTTLNAAYIEPEGLYTVGLDINGSGYEYAHRRGPGNREYTWKNASTGASSYQWDYVDFSVQDYKATSNDEDLTVHYDWASFFAPALTASDGTNTSVYDPSEQIGYRFAGSSYDQKAATDFGAMTYPSPYYRDDSKFGFARVGAFSYSLQDPAHYVDGTYNGWVSYLQKAGVAATTDKVDMVEFINIFPKPAGTFATTSAWGWLNVVATEATTLDCYLVKINDEGKFTNDTIAFGTANIAAGSHNMVKFDLETKDEFGFTSSDPINISSSFAMIVTGFNGNAAIADMSATIGNGLVYDKAVTSFPFEDEIHAYVGIKVTTDTQVKKYIVSSPWVGYVNNDRNETRMYAHSDMIFMVSNTYWWLKCDEPSYTFDAAGGSHTFALESMYPSQWREEDGTENSYTVVPVDPEADVDWIELSFVDNQTEDGGYTGETNATVVAEPLPEGVTGRSLDIKVSYPGAELILTVAQGDAGVEGVTVKAAQSVTVDGDNFVVKANDNVAKAEVFTAAGQKVAEAAVNGTTTIDAAGLANGLYIVKLDNGTAVKVVK